MCRVLRFALVAFSLGAISPILCAQETAPETQDPASAPEPQLTAQEQAAAFLQQFHPTTGVVKLGDYAVIQLGEGWQWLAGLDGQRMLESFGNPKDHTVAGVALPPDFAETSIFAVYSYAEDGHIEDDEPDYDELLETMKEGTKEGSKARKEAGLQGMELIGWAEPPHYDKEQHKLYWAKELMFEGEESATLNYSVRVLGRTGNIEINGVGDISQLSLVDHHCKDLLRVTEFVEGKRYSDFDPSYDKVAAYGIGGLIAGKLALKVGLFAKLGILLLKFLKPILVGLAVIGGILFKVIGGRKKAADEAVQPAIEE